MKHLRANTVSHIPFHSAYKATAHSLAFFSLKVLTVVDYHSYHNTLQIYQTEPETGTPAHYWKQLLPESHQGQTDR
jgi:hypothetical protein